MMRHQIANRFVNRPAGDLQHQQSFICRCRVGACSRFLLREKFRIDHQPVLEIINAQRERPPRKPMEQRCPVSLIPCGAPSSRQRRASSFTNARTSGASLDAAWARQREGHSPSQRQHAESREHHFSHEPLRGREIFRAGGSLCTQKRQSKNVSRETFRPQGLLCFVLSWSSTEWKSV